MKKFLLLLAVAVGAMTANAQYSIYQTRQLFSGYITNGQTVTASRSITNTTTVITTNANSVITTNVTSTVSPFVTIDTNWCDLALGPAGTVIPVDVQMFGLCTNVGTSTNFFTWQTTVNKRRALTSTIVTTNVLTSTTNAIEKWTIPAATFGNAQAFRLISGRTSHGSTVQAEVDYGFHKVRQ